MLIELTRPQLDLVERLVAGYLKQTLAEIEEASSRRNRSYAKFYLEQATMALDIYRRVCSCLSAPQSSASQGGSASSPAA